MKFISNNFMKNYRINFMVAMGKIGGRRFPVARSKLPGHRKISDE
jgi:hypothetical protein